jgi:DNA repair exonuclease SbcCD nuclease subunit
MKIAVLADTHLGHHEEFNFQNSRIKNIYAAIQACLFDAINRNVSIVVFAGDFFDNGKSLDALTLHYAHDIIKNCSETFSCTFFICGNHDISRTYDKTTLETLCGIYKNTKYIASERTVSHTMNIKDAVSKLLLAGWNANVCANINDAKNTLLIGHLAVTGATHMNQVMTGNITASKLSETFRLSLLGHFHTPQVLCENIRYVGSPIQHSFGEVGNDTGYVLFDTYKDKWTFISTDSISRFPKFFKINADECNFETSAFGNTLLDWYSDYFWVACRNELERQEFYEKLRSLNGVVRCKVTVEKQVARITKNEAVGGENVSLIHKMGKYLQTEVSGKYPVNYRKAAYKKYREDTNA